MVPEILISGKKACKAIGLRIADAVYPAEGGRLWELCHAILPFFFFINMIIPWTELFAGFYF
jgi:hypothetical protein